jgi:hypothetical protein
MERRPARRLFHSALEARQDGVRYVIEMAPVWSTRTLARGVVLEGPVGTRLLGRSRAFRYEVRCWPGGVLPDRDAAVASPVEIPVDRSAVERLLELLPCFPAATWGRDELATGEMWNSNSLTSWLLLSAGVLPSNLSPPPGGRAPGWCAGLRAARPFSRDNDLRRYVPRA